MSILYRAEQKKGCKLRRGPGALRGLALLAIPSLTFLALCTFMAPVSILAADASPAAQATAVPIATDEMSALIAAGKLSDLRWPNFSDVRPQVASFYAAGGNTLAWVDGGKPTSQALAMIQQFKQATQNGLDPEDYDASRWDGRVAALAAPSPDPVRFDLALTKIFPIHEAVNLKFRAEAFKVFNNPIFSNPQSNISNSTFGRITSTIDGTGRILQLALKLNF